MKRLIATIASMLMAPVLLPAQNANPRYAGQGYIVFGFGTGTGVYTHPLMWQVGGGGEGFLYKGLGVGAEAGIVFWTGGAWPDDAVTASGRSFLSLWPPRPPWQARSLRARGPLFCGSHRERRRARHTRAQLRRRSNRLARGSCRIAFGVQGHRRRHYWNFDHYVSWRIGMTFR